MKTVVNGIEYRGLCIFDKSELDAYLEKHRIEFARLRKFRDLWKERLGSEGTTQSVERLNSIDRRAAELLEKEKE